MILLSCLEEKGVPFEIPTERFNDDEVIECLHLLQNNEGRGLDH